jgi:AcrR family transcriptional regulator
VALTRSTGDEIERARLQEACIAAVVDGGYPGTSRDDVIAHSGLEPAAFDQYYEDFEACVLDTYEAAAKEMLRQVKAATAGGSWLKQMRALGVTMTEFLREDDRRARFIVVEVVSAGDRIRVARERDLAEICELIDRGRYELDNPESIGPDTAMAVAGAIFLRIYQGMVAGQLERAELILPEMMYTLVLPYLGEEAALAELHRRPAGPA